MYIAPGTDIYLLQGVPLDNKYENTIKFFTAQQQYDHFSTEYTIRRFTNQTYQRLERGYIRLKVSADSIAGYNYCMFRNTNYSTKWWYAFILGVEWINNEVAELRIELDVIQTWLFEAEPEACYIDRAHQGVSDNPGDNLVPENLETGEYISDDVVPTTALNDMVLVIAGTFDSTANPNYGSVYHRIYTGLHYEYFPMTSAGIQAANAFLNNYSTNPDGIVSVYMMPNVFQAQPDTLGTPTESTIQLRKYTTNTNSTNPYGFSINNNKLKTYPYCFLYCTNNNGGNAIYPYEYFSGQTFMDFGMLGDCNPNPSVMIYPKQYKGLPINMDEKLVMTGYPQCCFNIDTFRAHLAMISSQAVTSGFQQFGTLASGEIARDMSLQMAEGGFISAEQYLGRSVGIGSHILGNGISQVSNLVGSLVNAKIQHNIAPYQTKGTPSANLNVSTNNMHFAFYYKRIRDEFAMIIDQYFDMYGYAQHTIMHPPTAVRDRWSYVKTVGAAFRGAISADVANRLSELYDAGIRWYRYTNVSDIGNYSHALGAQNGILQV